MRLFCALLAIYVFALSVHTCSDGKTAGHQVCVVEQPNDADTDMDLCSPFCTCTCCTGVTLLKVDQFQQVLVMYTLVYSEGTATVLSMPRSPVWQPPQA